MYELAIESSCDETSVAILQDGRTILCNLISSQIDIHARFGGVVPEIASRKHLETINRILAMAFKEAKLSVSDIDLVCVTRGPGLLGALLVGVSAAKAISFARNIPIVGVNHMEGHICANFLAHPNLEPPFLTLVVSGGHTYLCDVADYTDYHVRGTTRDDAAGESFDKVARVLGLCYPGGPAIQALAEKGRVTVDYPRALLDGSYDFSFSGLKTAVINDVHAREQRGQSYNKADIAASFQQAVIDVLVQKSEKLLRETGRRRFCLSGGVAANHPLQEALRSMCAAHDVEFYVPPTVLCTDNAAMIGCAGHYQYLARGADDLSFAAEANLSL